MRALVTGGGGFLGRHIVNLLLQRDFQVRSFQRSSHQDLIDLGAECFLGDLRKYEDVEKACEGVDVVFHVAAKAGVWGSYESYHSINVTGTENILKACKKHKVPKLIYTSSPSVAFGIEAIEKGDETLPYPEKYLTAYPETKAIAERLVLDANCDELLTCALRPHLIWGPGDNHLIPRLVEAHRNGKLMQVGDGENLVDITYVENGAFAHIQAEQSLVKGSKTAGQAYFIGDQNPVKLWSWVNEMLETLGEEKVTKNISYDKARFVGRVMEVAYKILPLKGEPPMTRFIAAQLAKSHYFSHDKALQHYGYMAPISNDEGLKRLKDWWTTR